MLLPLFIEMIRSNDVQVDFLKIVDGNAMHPRSLSVIRQVLDYWVKKNGMLHITDVYQSFLILYRYLTNKSILDYGCFIKNGVLLDNTQQNEIISDLLGFANSYTALFLFNSIIITGNHYQLEAPYGVALGSIFEGGICINCNTQKNSLWHETAHLLGADDHYNETKNYQSKGCSDPRNCLMQWDSLKGSIFCSNVLSQLKAKLNRISIA